MRIEVRADDTVHISGYVNAVERESRPVITARGRVIELVEAGVFRQALNHAGDIAAEVDHDPNRVVARTGDRTLQLEEDSIGLRAELTTSDKQVAEAARKNKIKGWSFGMKKVQDTIEERADKLPLRRIKGFVLDHVTLVIDKTPCYSATSVELRADAEEEIETRAFDTEIRVSVEKRAEDYTAYEERLRKLKGV